MGNSFKVLHRCSLLVAVPCGRHVLNFHDHTEQHTFPMSCGLCDVLRTDVSKIKKLKQPVKVSAFSVSVVLKCATIVQLFYVWCVSFVISDRLCKCFLLSGGLNYAVYSPLFFLFFLQLHI